MSPPRRQALLREVQTAWARSAKALLPHIPQDAAPGALDDLRVFHVVLESAESARVVLGGKAATVVLSFARDGDRIVFRHEGAEVAWRSPVEGDRVGRISR
jgi:hypothetical protein